MARRAAAGCRPLAPALAPATPRKYCACSACMSGTHPPPWPPAVPCRGAPCIHESPKAPSPRPAPMPTPAPSPPSTPSPSHDECCPALSDKWPKSQPPQDRILDPEGRPSIAPAPPAPPPERGDKGGPPSTPVERRSASLERCTLGSDGSDVDARSFDAELGCAWMRSGTEAAEAQCGCEAAPTPSPRTPAASASGTAPHCARPARMSCTLNPSMAAAPGAGAGAGAREYVASESTVFREAPSTSRGAGAPARAALAPEIMHEDDAGPLAPAIRP
mmetsp:Transcript_29652/g.96937  ORF Transcript_29652/g.96937 Transcript_29652/m.96937 type:complete len:275 (+) Transcript_29652:4190-5014(+)